MSEMTADFMRSMPYLIVLSLIIIYAAWRVFCRQDYNMDVQTTRLNDVARIHFRNDGFAHILFRDGTTRLIEKKHLVLKDHNGQMFSSGPSLERCELIVNTDGTQMRGLVVEIPACICGEPNQVKTTT